MATPLTKPDSEVENLAGKLARAVADHPGAPRPRFMVLRRTCVYDRAEDWRIPAAAALEDARIFNGLFYNAAGVVNGFPTPMDAEGRAGTPPPPTAETLHRSLMFGTPEQVVARLRHYQRLGVDEYCYGPSVGVPHAFAMRSLELFGREVMPHFAEAAR
jgi:alkanesulfonate monooxygenase SsuD/methylene tetrahydromethanopterin reductase-like flavin-dependent oxidoreductase (luciferase family)